MTKRKLTLKHLNYLYLAIHLISYAIIIGTLIFIVQDCYLFYVQQNDLFQQIKNHTTSTAHLDSFLKTVFIYILWGLLKIVITSCIVLTIKFIVLRIPISANYLISLDKSQAISSIMGRYLSYHFRRHTSINFKTLVYLTQEAEYEKYILGEHNKKNAFAYFLKKYDNYFDEDVR